MEFTTYISHKKFTKITEVICVLMIGLGFGGLSMYWYAVEHPQQIMQAQEHVLIAPQDNTASKLLKPKANQLLQI